MIMAPMQWMPAEISEVRMLLWIGCYSSGHTVCPLIQTIWDERRGAVAYQTDVLSQGEGDRGCGEGYPARPPPRSRVFVSVPYTWRQSKLPADV